MEALASFSRREGDVLAASKTAARHRVRVAVSMA